VSNDSVNLTRLEHFLVCWDCFPTGIYGGDLAGGI
jgi:hypothetical protein